MSEKDIKKEDTRKKKDDTEEKEEGTDKKGFPSWIKWGIISLAVIIISGGAFTLTKFVIMPKYFSHKVNQVLEEKTSNKKKKKEEIGLIHYIKGITVNSKGSEGRRFIVTEFAVETKDKKVIEELKIRDPQIRNELITFLRQNTVEQVLEPSFQIKSKSILKASINSLLNAGEVDTVYYTQLIVQ